MRLLWIDRLMDGWADGHHTDHFVFRNLKSVCKRYNRFYPFLALKLSVSKYFKIRHRNRKRKIISDIVKDK